MDELTKIEKIIAKIIPPDGYHHREGFDNKRLIDELDNTERELVEKILIGKLLSTVDMLVVETLGYMKSINAIPALVNLLNQSSDETHRLIIACSIFEINRDQEMVTVCVKAFQSFVDKYQKIPGFYFLRKLRNDTADSIIEEYTKHSDYLLSYNAKRALDG